MKSFERSFAAMLLVLVFMFALITPAAAENVSEITLTFEGGYTANFKRGTDIDSTMEQLSADSIRLTATGQSGCSSDEPGYCNVTLTIPENTAITFDFETDLNNGSFTVKENATGNVIAPVGSNYTFSTNVTIMAVASDAKEDSKTTVTLSNINVYYSPKYDITVQGAAGGTLKVGSDTFTASSEPKTYAQVDAANGLAMQATPASGYSFVGFRVGEEETLVSANANLIYRPVEDGTTITPVFTNTPTLVAGSENVGWAACTTMTEAVEAIDNNGGNLIVPVNDFTVAAGEYTIPADVTLLVPNSSDYTPMNEKPKYTSAATPSVFRTLTLADDATVNVEGNLTLNANWVQPGGAGKIQISGAFSRVCLTGSASINMKDGSFLNAWGYIFDYDENVTGKVTAESGSQVNEVFQWTDWRGGTITSNIYTKILPLSQYYIQNVESKLQINHGATERAFFSVTGGGEAPEISVGVVGAHGSDSLFWLNTEGSSMTKWYDKSRDRVMIEFNGPHTSDSPDQNIPDFEMNSIKFSVMGYSLDSAPYLLPVNNMEIKLDNGTLNVRYKTEFLPDSGLEVGSNAILNIAKDGVLYLIDKNVWACAYYTVVGTYIRPVTYISTGTAPVFARTVNASKNTMTTAYCKVDGIVNVQGIFAVNTGNQANNVADRGGMNPARTADFSTITTLPNVYSDTDGAIVRFDYISTPPKVYGNLAYGGDKNNPAYYYYDEFLTESVWLNNADGSVVKTNQGTAKYSYNATAGEWNTTQLYTVKWCDFNSNELAFQTYAPGETPVFTGETPTIEDDFTYTYGNFLGWSTTPHGAIVVQPGGTFPNVGTADVTYYAEFERTEKKYTAVWKNWDGSEWASGGSEEYTYNQLQSLVCPNAGKPTKESIYSGTMKNNNAAAIVEYQGKAIETRYTFSDWSSSLTYDKTTGKGVCTYTPSFSTTTYYLNLYMNEDGNEVLHACYVKSSDTYYPYNEYQAKKQNSGGEYYTFAGWEMYYNSGSLYKTISSPTDSYYVYNPTSYGEDGVFYPKFTAHKIFPNHSLTLDGTIGVNFYVQLPEGYDATNTSMDFSWGQKFITTKEYDSETPNTLTGVRGKQSGTLIKFTLPLALKELNDTISVTLRDQNGSIIGTETYKPTDYAYKLLALSDDELSAYCKGSQTPAQLKELLRTMLLSAADAQTYFNYNTGDLATYRFEELHISPELTDVTVPAEKIKYPADDAFSGVTFYGSALNLEDETGYTLYFIINDPATYSVRKIGDVSAATTDVKGNIKNLHLDDELGVLCLGGNKKLRIKLDGLAAAEITNDIQLTYKGTTITVNPAEYIDLALEKGSDELKATVTALYHYNQAAIAFFGAEVTNG